MLRRAITHLALGDSFGFKMTSTGQLSTACIRTGILTGLFVCSVASVCVNQTSANYSRISTDLLSGRKAGRCPSVSVLPSPHVLESSTLQMTRHKKVETGSYSLNGHQLQNVTTAKYLGVTISSDLGWNQHIADITNSYAVETTKTVIFRIFFSSSPLPPRTVLDWKKLELVENSTVCAETVERFRSALLLSPV